MMENTQITCCFIGHRKIAEPETLRTRLRYAVEQLIRRGVVQFVFGDRSEFNDLCYEVVTELQETYPPGPADTVPGDLSGGGRLYAAACAGRL